MSENIIMSLVEKSSARKLQIPLGENSLLAVVAVCFVVLHVLAIAMLMSVTRSDAGAAPHLPGLSSGD
jgi:hypothetical protein